MNVRKESGLIDNDLFEAKVFLRSLNDAFDCAKDNSMKQTAKIHFKDYMRTLMRAMKTNRIMLD